jgi:hypothetical protein
MGEYEPQQQQPVCKLALPGENVGAFPHCRTFSRSNVKKYTPNLILHWIVHVGGNACRTILSGVVSLELSWLSITLHACRSSCCSARDASRRA